MLVDQEQAEQLAIPHEEGQWVSIRRLPWRILKSAREDVMQRALEKASRLPADFVNEARDAAIESTTPVDERLRYDQARVLHGGIVGWSYPVTADAGNIDLLDAKTADWLFKEILDRSVLDAAEGEE